jgi:hypothetical protein
MTSIARNGISTETERTLEVGPEGGAASAQQTEGLAE